MAIKSFQKTVAAAGTALQVSTDTAKRVYLFRAHQGNGGTNMFIGNDGADDVSTTTGLVLSTADPPLQLECRLSEMYVDTDNNGDKLCVMQVID